MRHVLRALAFELSSKALCRFADEIGLANAREEAGERGDTAGLRLAAGDPENICKTGQRLRRRIRVGRLRIVDEQNAAFAADLLHAVGEAGERA